MDEKTHFMTFFFGESEDLSQLMKAILLRTSVNMSLHYAGGLAKLLC